MKACARDLTTWVYLVVFYLEPCTGRLFGMSGRAWVNKMWCRGSQAGGVSLEAWFSAHVYLWQTWRTWFHLHVHWGDGSDLTQEAAVTRVYLRVWGRGLGSLRLWPRRRVHGGGGRLGKKRCPCHLWLCFCSLGVSEGDTEAGGLTGVVLAPGALGCGQGGGPLSAPISRQLFFRNVCLFTCPGPQGVSCGLFRCGRHHLVP